MGQTDKDRVRWCARDETRGNGCACAKKGHASPQTALMGRSWGGRDAQRLSTETAARQTDLSKIRILSKLSHFKRRRSR